MKIGDTVDFSAIQEESQRRQIKIGSFQLLEEKYLALYSKYEILLSYMQRISDSYDICCQACIANMAVECLIEIGETNEL
jgi:hypothetical protein